LCLIAITALLTACGGGGSSEPQTTSQTPVKAVVFGDSTTWGAKLEAGEIFAGQRLATPNPAKAESFGGLNLQNEARNGTMPSELINGTDGETYSGQAHIPFAQLIGTISSNRIVFAYGVAAAVRNDENFKESLRTLIRIAKANGKTVYLREPTKIIAAGYATQSMIEVLDRFTAEIWDLGNEEGVTVIPVRSIQVTEADLPDGIHPSQSYSDNVAVLLHQYIK
jgi:lysophospholipase L1-like esterase